jgi:hypothetical protein
MKRNNVVVYRVLSANGEEAVNFSYRTVLALMEMGILRHRTDLCEVIRDEDTTVTIYYHEKV